MASELDRPGAFSGEFIILVFQLLTPTNTVLLSLPAPTYLGNLASISIVPNCHGRPIGFRRIDAPDSRAMRNPERNWASAYLARTRG